MVEYEVLGAVRCGQDLPHEGRGVLSDRRSVVGCGEEGVGFGYEEGRSEIYSISRLNADSGSTTNPTKSSTKYILINCTTIT